MTGPTPEAVEALARVFREHRANAWRWGCSCGQMPEATEQTFVAAHREHLARVVLTAGYREPRPARRQKTVVGARFSELLAEVVQLRTQVAAVRALDNGYSGGGNRHAYCINPMALRAALATDPESGS